MVRERLLGNASARKTMKKLGIDSLGPEPIVRFSGFGEYGINLNVVMPVKEFTQQFALRHEFMKEIHRRYREEGIEIPYPVKKSCVLPVSV